MALLSTLFLVRRSRIADRPVGMKDSTCRQSSLLQPAVSHDVNDGLAPSEKIVGDEPSMTPPPDRFRAHDRTRLAPPRFDQQL